MVEDVLRALANPTSRAILNLLAVEPTYPRRIADLLALPETEVSRRLKQMETIGLVAGGWTYIGKNVKQYKLAADAVSVRFTPQGLALELGTGKSSSVSVIDPMPMRIPTPSELVGRERELAVLEGPESVVVLEGMPGIGKTSLVAAFAHGRSERGPVFWHSFRGVESLTWLANRLAVFLARGGSRGLLEAIEAGAEMADKRELMLQGLAASPATVVFDDIHRVQDEDLRLFLADAVRRNTKGKLVVAARERPRVEPGLSHVKVMRLGGLDEEGMASFLRLRDVHIDAKLLPRLRDEVGGHPLALTLLLEAARELESPIETLLDRVPERNLQEYLLDEVAGHLSDEEKLTLSRASVFRTWFTIDDLAAISPRDPRPALVKLRRRFLVQESGHEFGLHEVIRNFFYDIVQSKGELHQKAADHYLAKGTIEGRLEAMHHYLAAGRRDRILSLLERDLDLAEFDIIDGGYHNLYLSVLDLFSRSDVPDPKRWALIADEKGDIMLHRGRHAEALKHYDEAAPYFTSVEDEVRMADLAWKRAMALHGLGRNKEARAACAQGLEGAPKDSLQRRRLEELDGRLNGAPRAAPAKGRAQAAARRKRA